MEKRKLWKAESGYDHRGEATASRRSDFRPSIIGLKIEDLLGALPRPR
jgi:hypothetical protein